MRGDAVDDFMEYMLLLDDEEDEPKSDEKSGCGCLPAVLFGILLVLLIACMGHG